MILTEAVKIPALPNGKNDKYDIYGKQLVISNNEKESLTHSKQKETFEETANIRMEEIKNLINWF